MRITQIATTYGRPCGVGNFARSLETAMNEAGIAVRTVTDIGDGVPAADVTLVQHEWGVFSGDEHVRAVALACPQPVVVFAHTHGGVERFDDVASAYVTMAPGVVGGTRRPVFVLPHPAHTPARLSDRAVLRRRYGMDGDAYTIGSSGFLRDDHEFDRVLARLLPRARENGWRVELMASAWVQTRPAAFEALAALRDEYPHTFRYSTAFLEAAELNERLQACDLLWCWTREPSVSYASGSISDHYASGTRLVASDKLQYEHVVAMPNVVRAPAQLDAFVDRLVAEAASGARARHDPSPIAWRRHVEPLAAFLRTVRAAP